MGLVGFIALVGIPASALSRMKIMPLAEILAKSGLTILFHAVLGIWFGLYAESIEAPLYSVPTHIQDVYDIYYGEDHDLRSHVFPTSRNHDIPFVYTNKNTLKEVLIVSSVFGFISTVVMGFIWFTRPVSILNLEQELKRKKELGSAS